MFTCQEWYCCSLPWSAPGICQTLIGSDELTSAGCFTEMSGREFTTNSNFWTILSVEDHLKLVSYISVEGWHSKHGVKWISVYIIYSVFTFLTFSFDPWSKIFYTYILSTGSSLQSWGQNSSIASRNSGQGHLILNTSVSTHMHLCFPENKMLPLMWLVELALRVLYFHQTCCKVDLCVIALSPEVLCAQFCWSKRPHGRNFISLSPGPCSTAPSLSVSLYLHYRSESPREGREIWAGNKQVRLWCPSSDVQLCARITMLTVLSPLCVGTVRQPWINWKSLLSQTLPLWITIH